MDARPYEWSDLEIFLAAARGGTLAAAAESLRVDASTVHRRIGKLEAAMRAKLFVRSQRGYALTEVGQDLHSHALAMEEQATAAFRKVVARDEQPVGTLRVATVDDLAFHVLPPIVAKFRARHPHVAVEVDVRETFVDLSKNDADVALRFGRKPPDGDVVLRRLLSANLALYASRAYLREHGKPKTLDDLAGHALIRGNPSFASHPSEQLFERYGNPGNVALRSNSFHMRRSAIKAGVGIGFAPLFVAAPDKTLVRLALGQPDPMIGGDLLMVVHADLRKNARVRAFVEHVAAMISAQRALYETG